MVFGWFGFHFVHPDDWAPVLFSGDRKEGYVRIASPNRLVCQIKWKETDAHVGSLAKKLSQYMSGLEKDSSKGKASFSGDVEEADGRLWYRYSGSTFGRGVLFSAESENRVYFLELSSSRQEATNRQLKELLDTFVSSDGLSDRWAMLGLDTKLPSGLRVLRKTLLAGHIGLELETKGVHVAVDRWGFGQQLVEKHGLETWAQATLRMRAKAKVVSDCDIALSEGKLLTVPKTALVRYQPGQNQITTIAVSTRRRNFQPQWDWIAS